MSAPRLCLLFPHIMLGGGETAMMEVAEGLAESLDVSVAAFDNLEVGDVPTIREELRRRFDRVTLLRQRWELRPLLDQVDVLLWYGVVPQVPRALLSLETRPRSIRVVHTDRKVDGEGFQRRWRQAIDGVICVHPAVARRIPGGVFIPNTTSQAYLRGPKRAFFPELDGRKVDGRKTLGFLGRLVPLKNVPWLVDNVERLGCNLLIQALDTELLSVDDLKRRVEGRGLENRICFLPPGRDVGTLLRSVDALVIASRHEGFPMVVIEAGLVGTPVISTRVGALPELFADEILFIDQEENKIDQEKNDIDQQENAQVPRASSLVEALSRVDPSWGQSLGEKVRQLCSKEVVVGRYLEFIRSLA